MDKFEFQINYYFNKYKDEPIKNTKDFKLKFIKKHGEFRYLNEVILRINKYQVKKYGNGLIRFSDYETSEQASKKVERATQRERKARASRNGK